MDGFGLMDYNARWYDPYLTQFTQPDSFILDPYNPLDWNRYSYARYNPLKYKDTTGHWVETVLDLAFITYDVYQITQEGWTPVNTVALAADIACAVLPIATGGGPGIRAAFAGGEAALEFSKAAVHVPEAVRAGQVAEKAVQTVEGSNGANLSLFAKHHSWPQYLLGPKKQDLYNLNDELHKQYHTMLDKSIPRNLGKKFYESLFKADIQGQKLITFLEHVLSFNKYFDATFGTHTYETLENVLRDEGLLPKPKPSYPIRPE